MRGGGEEEKVMPEDKIDITNAQWTVLNHKAAGTIRKFINKTLFEHMSNFKNAYES